MDYSILFSLQVTKCEKTKEQTAKELAHIKSKYNETIEEVCFNTIE